MSRFLTNVRAFGASVALLANLTSASALSAPEWLVDADIDTAFRGKTLIGAYANGRRFSERYVDDGAVEYTDGGLRINGHWSIRSGTLCTIYDTDPTGGCFRVARAADNCYEFYFVTRSEEAAPGPPDGTPTWTARGAIEGLVDGCKEGANV